MLDALQPAFGELSKLNLRPSDIPSHKNDLKKALNEALADEWTQRRGIQVESIAMANISLSPEDEAEIQRMQKAATYSNPGMAAGMMADSTGAAMVAAASNPNGAMNGFVGMGMGANMGGGVVNGLFGAAQQQQQMQMQQPPAPSTATPGWKCECGTTNSGKFCQNCGKPQPTAAPGWTCECGATNSGKFCQNCGKPQPAAAASFQCNKCGWVPENPQNPPKFCPECGDVFDDNDKQ